MPYQIVENFLGKEACDYLNSYMKESNLLDEAGRCNIHVNEESGSNSVCMGWRPDIYSLLKSLKDQNLQDSLIYDLFDLIGQKMCNVFGLPNSEIIYETSHYKFFGPEKINIGIGSDKIGENGQLPHTDHWGEGGKIHTAVLYLNEEYEGGDIVFYEGNDPLRPTSYKMKTGSLAYFDGYSLHSVENLISGNRASFIVHIRHRDTY